MSGPFAPPEVRPEPALPPGDQEALAHLRATAIPKLLTAGLLGAPGGLLVLGAAALAVSPSDAPTLGLAALWAVLGLGPLGCATTAALSAGIGLFAAGRPGRVRAAAAAELAFWWLAAVTTLLLGAAMLLVAYGPLGPPPLPEAR